MKLLALDFEGYYDKDVTLKKLNIMEYVNHPKFKITGVATQFIDLDNLEAEKLKIFMGVNSADWYSEDEVQDHLESIDWEDTAVLCHHTDFDAYILSQKYGIKPKFHYDTMAMSRGKWPGKSSSLAALVERLFPDRPAIRKGNELASAKGIESYSPELDQIIGNYARNDVHVMVAAFAEMFPEYPKSELQIIDIVCRMFTQPKFVLDRDMTTKHRDDAKLNSTTKVAASGITKEVLGSSDQFVAYMKATYNIDIPMKQGKKKLIPALGKNDISFQNLQKQYPEHKAIWDARIASKSRIDETRATRFLNGTNHDGTISMPLKYYAAHCVPGDVGVLTRDGWVNIEDWNGGEIAQWLEGGTIQFLHADKFTGPIANNWVESSSPYMPVEMTLGHKVPSYQHSSWKFKELQAVDLLQKKSTYIPNGGHLASTGSITPYQMRVLAMVQADGHWETDTARGRCLTLNLKKPRKIARAKELLEDANVPFTLHNFPSQNGLMRFKIKWSELPAWLTPDRKFFGPWILDATPYARISLLDELKHWDGYKTEVQSCYSSSDLVNVQWIQTLAHLCGRSASYCADKGTGNRRDNYRLTIRDRAYCMVTSKQVKEIVKPQLTYCAKTQTGYWLARHNNQIFVTGNTGRFGGGEKMNPQNLKRGSNLRKALCAPEGYMVVVVDKSQIEARLTAWLAGCDKLVQAFRDKEDPYSKFASVIYQRLITKQDPIERFVGKTCILGLGFGVGGTKLQVTLESGSQGPVVVITEIRAKEIVTLYRMEYREIPNLWKKLEEIFIWIQNPKFYGQTYGPMTAVKDGWMGPNGMVMNYPEAQGLSFYDARYKMRKKLWGGILTENWIQFLARTDICANMNAIDDWFKANPHMDGMVSLQIHDEIICIVKTEYAEETYNKMLSIMTTPPAWAPDLPLGGEGGWAKEYSK